MTAEDHFQDTRHIELGLGDSQLAYEPGALLAVFPQQDPTAVPAFCKQAQLDPNARIRVEPEQKLRNGHSSSMEVSYTCWPFLSDGLFNLLLPVQTAGLLCALSSFLALMDLSSRQSGYTHAVTKTFYHGPFRNIR